MLILDSRSNTSNLYFREALLFIKFHIHPRGVDWNALSSYLSLISSKYKFISMDSRRNKIIINIIGDFEALINFELHFDFQVHRSDHGWTTLNSISILFFSGWKDANLKSLRIKCSIAQCEDFCCQTKAFIGIRLDRVRLFIFNYSHRRSF